MAKFIPFAKSDASYLSGNPDKGDWDRATGYTLNSWLPNRRTTYLNAMQNAGLYQP